MMNNISQSPCCKAGDHNYVPVIYFGNYRPLASWTWIVMFPLTIPRCGYQHAVIKGTFTQLAVLLQRGAALPRGAVNWIQLIATGIFTLAGGSLAARGKLGPWANLRCRCARFGTNPPACEAVPCVKAPFRPLADVPLPLTHVWNSALCKRSSGNGAARQHSVLCKSGLMFPLYRRSTVWLSTSPTQPLTHWYQVRCLLQNPIFVKQGQTLTGKVVLRSNKR